jgi:hypothetical protein
MKSRMFTGMAVTGLKFWGVKKSEKPSTIRQ